MITGDNWQVHIGSNLDVLPTLPDNSVDSIVTDPPYELGFMGKKWDSSGIAYSNELWRECLRVLKPGGHLLSFGGTRTWHRVAVAIEDSGFEVRDSIAWMYGSGFPKSLDISKAIDKSDAAEARRKRDLEFTSWMRSTGLTAKQINELTNSAMGSHYITDKEQPSVATEEMLTKLRPYLPEVPDYIEKMVAERTIESENFKNREVIGQKTSGIANKEEKERHTIGASKSVEVDITAAATPEAQQWEGWGTALKPAFEPIVVARKPLIGTVAQNVLTHGTGGLNIDGSRISFTSEQDIANYDFNNNGLGRLKKEKGDSLGLHQGGWKVQKEQRQTPQGRWPANVILDEYSAEILDEQSGIRPGGTFPARRGNSVNTAFASGQETAGGQRSMGDSGGASRFFYVAKASKRDRNEGLEELPKRMSRKFAQDATTLATMSFGKEPVSNFHPTVKPTDLMRYLVKLVTPPGGTVLDPFTGSGSTGKAAILEGFDFIGIELTEDYIPIIEGRLKHAEQMRAEQAEEEKEKLF